ncbi:MAG: hypothetical protein AMJ46_00255 [Latescibacteria bacterium DG_63]|nr:MAG: hypothetical protein AMJ46_00255 [Latescibacteria bacterium DG_63]
MTRVIALVVMAMFALPVAALAGPPAALDTLWTVGDHVVTMLASGDVDSVVTMLHYPPSYSKEELASEVAGIAGAIKFLLAKLGSLDVLEPFSGETLCYDIGLSAGDPGYWESLSPLNTVDLVYKGKFDKFGGGFVSISFFEIDGAMDLRAIVLRLEASVPEARETAIDISLELARRQAESTGETLPENLRELISASVPDLSKTEE